MRKQKWFTKLSKCDFWLKEVTFLGHVISKEGVIVYPAKVRAIVEWKALRMYLKYVVSWASPVTIEGS